MGEDFFLIIQNRDYKRRNHVAWVKNFCKVSEEKIPIKSYMICASWSLEEKNRHLALAEGILPASRRPSFGTGLDR
jgi:hypothetical protein